MRLTLSLCIVFASVSFAADSIDKKPAPPADPPKISAELRAQYWRASKSMSDANAQAIAAKAALDTIAAQMAQACGNDHQAAINDKTGEPECFAKPKPEAKK